MPFPIKPTYGLDFYRRYTPVEGMSITQIVVLRQGRSAREDKFVRELKARLPSEVFREVYAGQGEVTAVHSRDGEGNEHVALLKTNIATSRLPPYVLSMDIVPVAPFICEFAGDALLAGNRLAGAMKGFDTHDVKTAIVRWQRRNDEIERREAEEKFTRDTAQFTTFWVELSRAALRKTREEERRIERGKEDARRSELRRAEEARRTAVIDRRKWRTMWAQLAAAAVLSSIAHKEAEEKRQLEARWSALRARRAKMPNRY